MLKSHSILICTKVLLLALCCSSITMVRGQQPNNHQPTDYIFTSYTAANGLLSSEVISLETDKKGYLWIGTTAGLSRYDGYAFANFTYAEDGHFIGIVNVIRDDKKGQVWIGTSSGLFCYSGYRLLKVSAETGSQQAVNDLFADVNGNLWLATEIGPVFIRATDLDSINNKKLRLSDFVLRRWTDSNSEGHERRCQLIKASTDGAIYFSQSTRIFRVVNDKLELIHTTKEENDKIGFILPVSRSKVFFDGAVTGLSKIENDKHVPFYYKDLYQPDRRPAKEGIWYVGSLGIVQFHPDEEFISSSISFKSDGVQWLSAILKENSLIWLATHNGLVKIKPSFFHLYVGHKFNDVEESFSFCQLRSGSLLTGVNRGKVYELTGNSVKYYFPGGKQPVPHAEIKSMYEDERGWLWIGTGYQGLALYRNGELKRFTNKDSRLHDNSFYAFLRAGQKLFAIGDGGMTEIIVDASHHLSFRPYYYPPVFSQHAKFYGGIQSPDGTIWIGGEEGICRLENDSLVAYPLFGKNVSVRGIKMGKNGSVWIATAGEGVYCAGFDQKNKLYITKHYNEKNGLNTSQYLDIFIDNNEDVWAGSTRGLTYISNSNAGRIVNFGETDGFLRPGYYTMTIYQDRQGMVWAGTTKGIASFHPGDLFFSTPAPKVFLSGVGFIKNENKTLNSDSIIASNATHELSLPYFSNSLHFNYTAIDHSDAAGLKYFYRMEGLDTGWISAGLRRDITYHNLPANRYVFKVKAINDKGTWSENEAVFSFSIKPPFWQTWWFRVAVFLKMVDIAVDG